VAAALDNLGEIDRAQHRYHEAIANYRGAAAIWERLGSADRADALANLGEVERLQGDFAAAEADLERAVSILEARFGADSSRASPPLVSLARVALAERQPTRASALLERVLRIDDANPADPVDRADAEFALARALRMLDGGSARAQTLAHAALAAYTSAGPRGSSAAGEVRTWLNAGAH
jgi:tetratricopeptide (TPR) repeat protein